MCVDTYKKSKTRLRFFLCLQVMNKFLKNLIEMFSNVDTIFFYIYSTVGTEWPEQWGNSGRGNRLCSGVGDGGLRRRATET